MNALSVHREAIATNSQILEMIMADVTPEQAPGFHRAPPMLLPLRTPMQPWAPTGRSTRYSREARLRSRANGRAKPASASRARPRPWSGPRR